MIMAATSKNGIGTLMPIQKVSIGALVGAAVTIACWLLARFGNVAIPDGVEGALVMLLTFAASWLVPPAPDEGVIASADETAQPQGPAKA